MPVICVSAATNLITIQAWIPKGYAHTNPQRCSHREKIQLCISFVVTFSILSPIWIWKYHSVTSDSSWAKKKSSIIQSPKQLTSNRLCFLSASAKWSLVKLQNAYDTNKTEKKARVAEILRQFLHYYVCNRQNETCAHFTSFARVLCTYAMEINAATGTGGLQ